MRDRAERPKPAKRAPEATERSGRSEGAERPERGREALGAPGASVPQVILKHVCSAASSSFLAETKLNIVQRCVAVAPEKNKIKKCSAASSPF